MTRSLRGRATEHAPRFALIAFVLAAILAFAAPAPAAGQVSLAQVLSALLSGKA